MKSRLTFTEMQTFIEGVTNETILKGFGYKQFYIDFYTAILYGEKNFGGTEENPRDISEIYEELNETNEYMNKIDFEQYNTILSAIDEEIQHRLNLMYVPTSETDTALALLVDKISTIVDKFGDMNLDGSQVSTMAKIFMENKDNFSADKLVGAMKKNGLLTGTDTKSKSKKKSVANVAETKSKIEKIK